MRLFFFALSFFASLCFSDDFIKVKKAGVDHTFIKINIDWVNDFLQKGFPDWELDTFAAFEEVKNPKGVAIDIGAWLGTTAIWLSKNFSSVLAIEADRESVKALHINLAHSDCKNVLVCDKAISDTNAPVIFGPRLSFGDGLNNSTSYVKKATDLPNSVNNYTCPSITLSEAINDYLTKEEAKKLTFIKCDIEGGEEKILKDLLQIGYERKCSLWISFHYDWWETKNLETYDALFDKFKRKFSEKVSAYIKQNPFGSVLLTP